MTGFKSGASGDDPFATSNDDGTDDEDEPDTIETPISAEPDPSFEDPSTDDAEPASPTTGGLPWIYRRDSITDGRAKTVQLHLQQSTLDEQRDAKTSLENELGETVNKADLREAAVLVGLRSLDDVEDILREWGYDVS